MRVKPNEKAEYLALRKTGKTPKECSKAVGVHIDTAYNWERQNRKKYTAEIKQMQDLKATILAQTNAPNISPADLCRLTEKVLKLDGKIKTLEAKALII